MTESRQDGGIVEIFTDGSCLGNPGPGGWAALLRFGDREKLISGREDSTTNNRMELIAAIEALEALKRPSSVRLTTDSQYIRKGITEWIKSWKKNGWKTAAKKPVKNRDLWRRLDEVASKHDVRWEWVRGHNQHRENEIVDGKAREAAAGRC